MIQEALEKILEEGVAAIAGAGDAAALEEVRLRYLSRKGAIPALMESFKGVPASEKPALGKKINEAKTVLQQAFDARKEDLAGVVEPSKVDVTLPATPVPAGALHPMSQVTDRAIQILRRMGFALADGPDIETEFHNFDALNTPPDHPARNEQDTFYVDRPADAEYGRWLLRSQTSPVQIRVMQSSPPPYRIICPGRCYRRDEIDATHLSSFHQIEGLAVDEQLSLADLKGVLESFFHELLGPSTKLRFRPHFFPFTEPSFEVDLANPAGQDKGRPWLEIAGCGMVDPAVFAQCGVDTERYRGFAFGMGLERLAFILHGVPDLRHFEQNDLRFLRQFA